MGKVASSWSFSLSTNRDKVSGFKFCDPGWYKTVKLKQVKNSAQSTCRELCLFAASPSEASISTINCHSESGSWKTGAEVNWVLSAWKALSTIGDHLKGN